MITKYEYLCAFGVLIPSEEQIGIIGRRGWFINVIVVYNLCCSVYSGRSFVRATYKAISFAVICKIYILIAVERDGILNIICVGIVASAEHQAQRCK